MQQIKESYYFQQQAQADMQFNYENKGVIVSGYHTLKEWGFYRSIYRASESSLEISILQMSNPDSIKEER